MSNEQPVEPGAFEAIAEAMAPQEPDILPIDHAEELMAVKMFYETRTIGLWAALRREQQKNADLVKSNSEMSGQLNAAQKGLEELREEFTKLSGKPSGKAN